MSRRWFRPRRVWTILIVGMVAAISVGFLIVRHLADEPRRRAEAGALARGHAYLEEGRFRLLVAVDTITDELRRSVEYINRHTVPEVQLLALQLQYRRDGDVEILLPTIYGQETAQKKAAGASHTSEEKLFAELRQACSREGFEAVRCLYEWSMENGMNPAWRKGLTARFEVDGVEISPWSCCGPPSTSGVSPNFGDLAGRSLSQERVDRFLSAREEISGVALRLTEV